ncbi:MAG: glycosyltransferase family 4 protein, partial [Aquificae bacterium]|nr:glycosyltransferase family 4 protein [Aquificota bacterium]
DKINLSCILYDRRGYKPTLKKTYKSLSEKVAVESIFLAYQATHKKLPSKNKIRFFVSGLKALIRQKINYQLMETKLLWKMIWEIYLSQSLSPNEAYLTKKTKHYLLDISFNYIHEKVLRSLPDFILEPPKMNNSKIIIFPFPTSIKVIGNNVKAVHKIHDLIPILYTNYIDNVDKYTKFYRKTLDRITKYDNSYFVCISEPVREEFLNVYPHIEDKTIVIPNVLPDTFYNEKNLTWLGAIIKTRLSSLHKNKFIEFNTEKKYILHVGTIEPKKNHINLIKAYEFLKYKYQNKDFILILVGNLGWKYEEVLKKIKILINKNQLIHLSNLSPEELRVVYSHASVVCTPSFVEGFSFTPAEAAKCGTPSVISDIPAHKWVMKDGAVYCNPYSYKSIAQGLETILFKWTTKEKEELIRKAQDAIARFSIENIQEKWEDYLLSLTKR